jgi:glycosyltransferase involved in cell wall biosynthesis
MHVAIDARYLNESHSGIAKYSENLLASLSHIDPVSHYTVFIHNGFQRRLKVGRNFTVVEYPARPISMRTLTTFGHHVRRTGCDFLHSLYPIGPVFGVPRQILTVHDLQPFITQETFSKGNMRSSFGSLFYRAAFPHFIRSASWLLSVSQATKAQLTSLFPDTVHKTIVVHSGVEDYFSQPPEGAVAQMVTRKLQLPPLFVLYLGSAQPNKNLPMMIRAFARCREEHPNDLADLQFIMVVGRDRYFADCARLIRSLRLTDHVRAIGPITEEEKHVLYSRARLLFSVTRGEGFGFPIVEAQACGLPVLAGNDASTPEVTGDTAFLTDPNNEDEITAALTDLLLDESLRSYLSEAGRRNVKRFSWQKTAEHVRQIYGLLM